MDYTLSLNKGSNNNVQRGEIGRINMPFNFELQATQDSSRQGHLRIGGREVLTPYWVLLHTERQRLTRGINLINHSPPTIEIHEIVLDCKDQNALNATLGNANLQDRLRRKILSETRNNTENIFQLRVPSDVIFSRAQIETLIRVQSEVPRLSLITIPDPEVGNVGLPWQMQIMPRALQSAAEYVDTGVVNTFMPTVSLNQPVDIVEQKVRWLLRQNVPAIGFRAVGSFASRLHAAMAIVNASDTDVWVHLFDLQKKYLSVSQMHLTPLAGVDTVSVKKGTIRGQPPQIPLGSPTFPTPEGVPLDAGIEEPAAPTNPDPRDLFEGRALGFLTGNEQIQNFGHELNCRCPVCSRAHFSAQELLELLSQTDRSALLKVHEHVAFPLEFQQIQTAIHNNDLENYYNEKSLINTNRDRISERYPRLGTGA